MSITLMMSLTLKIKVSISLQTMMSKPLAFKDFELKMNNGCKEFIEFKDFKIYNDSNYFKS